MLYFMLINNCVWCYFVYYVNGEYTKSMNNDCDDEVVEVEVSEMSDEFPFRYQTNMVSEVLDTILGIQPKDSGGTGGETREDAVYKQTQEMLDKLPPNYPTHQVKHPSNTPLTPQSPHSPGETPLKYPTHPTITPLTR